MLWSAERDNNIVSGIMRSFRLDPNSVTDFFDAWLALLIALLLVCLAAYLGIANGWGRVITVLASGTYFGFSLRGVGAHPLRERYPGARWFWLLTVGLATSVVGAATLMAFPAQRATAFDLTWLGVSFFAILAFILANRKNENVVR